MKIDNEPTLDTIDDYDNNETPEKRKTIYLIIIGLIIFVTVLSILKLTYNEVSDYVGTASNPGIDLTRH